MADRAERRPMGAAAGNRDGLNRNLYEEISLLYAACGGRNEGACVPRCAGRNPPRASACRNAPPAAWKSRSVGRRRRNDRASVPSRYGQRWRRTERPPLWGSDDVSAMRNYRYRHRDSPYVAKRSGERTSRAGRPWAVGGELPGARWRGRPVRAMRSAVQGAAAAQTRACRFFSSTSILGCGVQGAGGAERRTDQFSVRLF